MLHRVRGREVGSGYEDQAPRTIEQAHLMAEEPGQTHVAVDTTGKSVPEIAREILDRTGWLNKDHQKAGS